MDYSMLLENDAIVMNDFESFEGPDAIQAPPKELHLYPLRVLKEMMMLARSKK